MKRTLKYALTAVLGAAIVTPTFAQDNFPDVPDNHWAYEALARMKRDGLLVGYPDGLFRGGRPASRYEMAVAIHATYVHLKNITDSLQSQISALQTGGNASDIQAMKDAIAALQNDVNALKGLRGDVDNLRRLTETFQKELQALGVDVEAMKRDLGDLTSRVEALEKRKLPVDISGDVNFWLGGGHNIDNNENGFLNKDARGNWVGSGRLNGFTRDATILHEVALTLSGTNETGPKWRGTIVTGNMLGYDTVDQEPEDGFTYPFGDQSTINLGGAYGEGPQSWYVQDLGIKFDTSVAGLAFNAEAGRVGYKISPFIYQRPDKTEYFENSRWDDGMWRMDGAILGFNFGGAKLDIFGGKNAIQVGTENTVLNPMVLGYPTLDNVGTFQFDNNSSILIDRSLGANLNIPLSTAGNVNVAYIFLQSDNPALFNGEVYDRVSVLGGSLNYNVGGIRLEGGITQTNQQRNTNNVNDEDNIAFYGKISYAQPSWSIFAGYREIGAYFAAPGDWGRLGIIRNPVNIKGVQVGGNIDLTPGLSISATGDFYTGKDDEFGNRTGWDEDTKISKWAVNLGYNLTSNLNIGVGYEENRFEDMVNTTGEPRFRWTTVNLGYGLSETARLLLRYELSDHQQLAAFGAENNGKFRGGFLTTQLSLKF